MQREIKAKIAMTKEVFNINNLQQYESGNEEEIRGAYCYTDAKHNYGKEIKTGLRPEMWFWAIME